MENLLRQEITNIRRNPSVVTDNVLTKRINFPSRMGEPQRVVLICNSKDDEEVYNIHFQAGKLTECSGSIADKLLNELPSHFEALACSGMISSNGVELPYCYIKHNFEKNTY